MSHRERFFAAVDLKQPDMVPITDLGLDSPIIEAIKGESLSGFSLVGGSWDNPWTDAVESGIALVKACLKLGFDGVPIISDYALRSRNYKPKILSGTRFIDKWGRYWT